MKEETIIRTIEELKKAVRGKVEETIGEKAVEAIGEEALNKLVDRQVGAIAATACDSYKYGVRCGVICTTIAFGVAGVAALGYKFYKKAKQKKEKE